MATFYSWFVIEVAEIAVIALLKYTTSKLAAFSPHHHFRAEGQAGKL